MPSRLILCFVATLLGAPVLLANERPNIVFFFTDDQTTSTLGCYGNPIVKTPNIDALARRGVRFENAFVSHSICWVSRTTILTGLVGRSYGTPSDPDQARPDAVETLYSDILREHGYRTGYFGKWHAKMPSGYRREDHFDEFEAIGRNPYYKNTTGRQPAARDGIDRRSRHRVREESAEGQAVRAEHVVQRLPRRGRRSSPRHRAFPVAESGRRDVRGRRDVSAAAE